MKKNVQKVLKNKCQSILTFFNVFWCKKLLKLCLNIDFASFWNFFNVEKVLKLHWSINVDVDFNNILILDIEKALKNETLKNQCRINIKKLAVQCLEMWCMMFSFSTCLHYKVVTAKMCLEKCLHFHSCHNSVDHHFLLTYLTVYVTWKNKNGKFLTWTDKVDISLNTCT